MFALLKCVTTKLDTNCATDCNYYYFLNHFNVLNIHTRHGNEEYVMATTEGVVTVGIILSNVYYSSVLFTNEQLNRGSCKFSA